jgi:2-desacetyl-2-hydroxyethyl bacteriochlorophyllide A dehydrogenase
MRAAVLEGPGKMQVGAWPTPTPGAGQVLVKVAAAGICMGDLHIWNGKNPYAKYPCICGHEMSGTIADVGPGVTLPSVGPVVVEPFVGCGTCSTCRTGKRNCCPKLEILGVTRPGGYAEYVVAPATHIHAVPAGLAPPTAALAEPVAIGVQAIRRGQITAADTVLVLGCGPIGLAALEVARARGATVLAADVVPARLEAAGSLGARVFTAGPNLGAEIRAHLGEDVAVVVEATGNPAAMAQSLDLVAHGGRIVILGLVKDGLPVSFKGLDLTRKEPTILGSRASVDCFPEALALLAAGKIQLARMVSPLSLWDAPAIFAELVKDTTSMQKALLCV